MISNNDVANLIKHRADSLQRQLEEKFPTKPDNWSKLPLHYVDKTVHFICTVIPQFCAVFQDSLEVMVDTDDQALLEVLNKAKIIVAWEPLTFRKMSASEKEIILSSDPQARI